jgi:1-deoxy-D-xylulose-5-phosphate synthase
LHLCTKKGYGYDLAEKDPVKYHGVGPFNPAEDLCAKTKQSLTYAEVFERTVLKLAETDKRIVLITPAMLAGSCLERFKEKYPTRCFDVGIAEQHAVTFAAGLAIAGLKPIVVIYSTFLQRAYDQVVHDVCMPGLNVTFAIDRAGLVGEDGKTHHGLYDIGFLRSQPKLVLMMPKDGSELEQMVKAAVQYDEGPIAVRYPKGASGASTADNDKKQLEIGRAEVLIEGRDVTLFAVGPLVTVALDASKLLLAQHNIRASVVNARFIKPLDQEQLLKRADAPLLVLEEGMLAGGLGSAVLEVFNNHSLPVQQINRMGIADRYVNHASHKEQLALVGLTKENVVCEVLKLMKRA